MYFSSVCYKKYVLLGKKSFNNIQSMQLAAFSKCITKKRKNNAPRPEFNNSARQTWKFHNQATIRKLRAGHIRGNPALRRSLGRKLTWAFV